MFAITCDCVVLNCMCVCVCNDSMGPQKNSLWLSGSPQNKITEKKTLAFVIGSVALGLVVVLLTVTITSLVFCCYQSRKESKRYGFDNMLDCS